MPNQQIENIISYVVSSKCTPKHITRIQRILNLKPLFRNLQKLGISFEDIEKYTIKYNRMVDLDSMFTESIVKFLARSDLDKAKITKFIYFYFTCSKLEYCLIHHQKPTVATYKTLIEVISENKNLCKPCPKQILDLRYLLHAYKNCNSELKLDYLKQFSLKLISFSEKDFNFYFTDRLSNVSKYSYVPTVFTKLDHLLEMYRKFGIPVSTKIFL